MSRGPIRSSWRRCARIDGGSERYLPIPGQYGREGYRDMEEFIATVRDPRLAELLEVADHGLIPRSVRRLCRERSRLRARAITSSILLSGRQGQRIPGCLPRESCPVSGSSSSMEERPRRRTPDGRTSNSIGGFISSPDPCSGRSLRILSARTARSGTRRPLSSLMTMATLGNPRGTVPRSAVRTTARVVAALGLALLSSCESMRSGGTPGGPRDTQLPQASEPFEAYLEAGQSRIFATRVLVTLWEIDDGAAQRFMEAFYQALLVNAKPPAAALEYAQRQLRESEEWSSPFYWAAFVLLGDGG